MTTLLRTICASPLGTLTLFSDDDGICRLDFDCRMDIDRLNPWGDDVSWRAGDPFGARTALRAYFKGQTAAVNDIPLSLSGTEFQLDVWDALCDIPCGETRSYGEIAAAVGRPAAVRAVGMANNANPVGIIVPCHRVIGSNGSLTGYGGGLDKKAWLLAHEGAIVEA